MTAFYHVPVLLREAVDGLQVRPGGTYVDGTMGGGGHSSEVLARLGGTGRLIGIDQDREAVAVCRQRLGDVPNLTIVNDNFRNIKSILSQLQIDSIDGALLDLGVSSYQIDNAARGFSYMADAPLDMRMDQTNSLDARTVVNTYSADKLSDIFFAYGEERFSRRIAASIVAQRTKKPIETTGELADMIRQAIPERMQQRGSHPAKRVFQAIRIEVNGELQILQQALEDFFDSLKSGGRLCVITFHSLEDRIVKQTFASFAAGCICPKDFPICVCGRRPRGKVITRKPIEPDEGERERNPRAKSAKLRMVQKI